MLAAPASAAQPGRSQCISELAQTGVFGKGVNPGKANIIVGTEGDDTFGTTPDGRAFRYHRARRP